ncbi:WhiB family transcriptional regulator [Streptomyces sp. x-80]|uniref:WhiB family transcriptional regulator n=1 Tax=Streptomyces sp. x-80 TaxID=2789282 RepID=UPI003980B10D
MSTAPDAFPCSQEPDLWHSPGSAEREQARQRCGYCPFILPCREAGREGREYGIWGGEGEAERAKVGREPRGWRRAQRVPGRFGPPPQPCGTQTAWIRHRRAGEEPCAPCTVAHEEHLAHERRLRTLRRAPRAA